MLKYRLLYGILMTVVFTAIVIFDGWLDGSLTASSADDRTVQGTLLCILIAGLIIPAQLELSRLAKAKNLRIFTPVAIIASVLFACTWYWRQLIDMRPMMYLFFLLVSLLWALLLYQYFQCGTSGVIANCGASYFSIIYLGLFSAFVVGIRIDYGLWGLLMFIFVVKSSDIGAYAIGVLFGKHQFSPNISPGKTWEGMGGAVTAAVIVSFLFGAGCDIMAWWPAVIFGIFIAFTGQVGDLVESMMKRDSETKDSSNKVPGFGGILDIIDSPLFSAPFAYLFFTFAVGK
jgi:phosphatidate cytidylyltransferase